MTRYDPNLTVLVDKATRRPVEPGEQVTDFRGDKGVLAFARASEGLNGKVYVHFSGNKTAWAYYPSAFGLEFADPGEVAP